MNWANPNILLFLILIPIFFVILFFIHKIRYRQLRKFCDDNLVDFFNSSFSGFYYNLRTFLIILVFAFIVIALARPQWDKEVRIVDQHGQDIVFVVDVSKSMDANDISPTRLERAKNHINLFLDELKGDRVGIVGFAGKSVVLCPLTTDYAALKFIISSLNSETITAYGTNIGSALQSASELFNKETNAKTIILLSDGEDLEQEGVNIAKKFATQGVVIYSLGIGSPEGSPLLLVNEKGQKEYAKDDKGNVIVTKLDVSTLMNLANETNGKFYLISSDYSEIYEVLKKIDTNEKSKYSSTQLSRYKEQYHYFVIIALIFLLLESFIFFKVKE
ncbi:MAG: VWA domain-containing protein, partial [Candidatus Cloacimonetes bacterium]|nr:VWA domain-containing protein [Candidatus Cloacimonadota bacterium]